MMEKIQKKKSDMYHKSKKEIVAFFSCSDDSALGDLVTRWVSKWVRDLLENITTEWPQRLVTLRNIWSEWWDDMTWPKNSTYPPTYLSTYLRAHPQDVILETCDLYDICSEWWGDLTWPKKTLRCCDIWDTDYNTVN